MTKDEALRLALEALEDLARYENPQTMIQIRKKDGGSIVTMYPHKVASDAITAIKAALEAKDEPDHSDELTIAYMSGLHRGKEVAQRTWIGLTDEETIAIELGLRIPTGYRDAYDLSLHDFARAIEAKLKEKNT